MADVIEIVLKLLDRVLVALAVRIIHLSPPGDPRFNQVPEMIKWNRLLIALGTLGPFCAWANQTKIAFKDVPKLRQLIEVKFPQPTSNTCNAGIVFTRVNVFILFAATQTHGAEFENVETSSYPTNSSLLKKYGTAVLDADQPSNQCQERSAKDQRHG